MVVGEHTKNKPQEINAFSGIFWSFDFLQALKYFAGLLGQERLVEEIILTVSTYLYRPKD